MSQERNDDKCYSPSDRMDSSNSIGQEKSNADTEYGMDDCIVKRPFGKIFKHSIIFFHKIHHLS